MTRPVPPLREPAPGLGVLLVEADDQTADRVRHALEVTARPGDTPALARAEGLDEALAWLRSHPTPDCVLLGLAVPDAAGTDALDAILRQVPWLPVVALTAGSHVGQVRRLLAHGAQDWLDVSDRIAPEVLGRTLHHAVQRGHAYAELGRSRDELARFAHTVAHDVKGPIAIISGYLDLAVRLVDEGDQDRARPLMDRARAAAWRLAEMTDGLLTYAEVPVGESHERIDLTAVVGWVRDLVEPSLTEADGTLEVVGSLPRVQGHEAGLRQVLLNLTTNAVKYRDPARPLRVEISASRNPEDLVEVVVRDTGRGIPAGQREAVFAAGVRGTAATPGLGLGLAAVRRVVERHRGRIWIEEPPDGVGTAVHFTLVPG